MNETATQDPILMLKGTMTEPGFAILIHLMNWAATWQQMNTDKFEMSRDHADSMLMLFRGVGGDPMAWPQVAPNVLPLIRNEVAMWMADSAYRAANPMPWCMFKVAAPGIAGATKGYEFEEQAHRILAEHFTSESFIDIPSPAAIRTAAAARTEAAAQSFTGLNGPTAGSGAGQPSRADPFAGVGASVRRSV